MRKKFKSCLAGALAAAALAPGFALAAVRAGFGGADFADTEAAAEAVFGARGAAQTEFRLSLALDAPPSNNLEAAVLDGRGETAAALGWDCGEIFIKSGVARGVSRRGGSAGRMEITLLTRLDGEGRALSTSAGANGFPARCFHPGGDAFSFPHSTQWRAVRMTARGAGAKDERAAAG